MRTDAGDYRPGYNPAFLRKVWQKRQAEQPSVEIDEEAMKATRHVPKWVREIVFETAKKHGVEVAGIMSSRARPFIPARREAIYRVKATKQELSAYAIGKWFGLTHTSIIECFAVHSEQTGAPPLTAMKHGSRAERHRKNALAYKRRKKAEAA